MGWRKRLQLLIGICVLLPFVTTQVACPSYGDEPSPNGGAHRRLLVVVGAAGEEEFGKTFQICAERWKQAFQGGDLTILGYDNDTIQVPTDHDRIRDWVQSSVQSKALENWIVLIGHGTVDRSGAKFNLQGPDVSSTELSKWLKEANAASDSSKRWVLIDCSSSSGPFINALTGKARIVITGTKSGSEVNYSRFGEYLSQTILDSKSDLDHDHSVSILEAFLAATALTSKYYDDEGRLASEQALLDDNGDGRGTPGVFYRGIRPVKSPAKGLELDGFQANQVIIHTFGTGKPIDETTQVAIHDLENRLEALRRQKSELTQREYYGKVESLLLEIAKLRR